MVGQAPAQSYREAQWIGLSWLFWSLNLLLLNLCPSESTLTLPNCPLIFEGFSRKFSGAWIFQSLRDVLLAGSTPAKCMNQLKPQDYPEIPFHLCPLARLTSREQGCTWEPVGLFSWWWQPVCSSHFHDLPSPCPMSPCVIRAQRHHSPRILQGSVSWCFPTLWSCSDPFTPLLMGLPLFPQPQPQPFSPFSSKSLPLLRVQSKSGAQNIPNL